MKKAAWWALSLYLAGLVSLAPPVLGEGPNVIEPNTPSARQNVPAVPANGLGANGLLVGPWLRLPDLPESKE